MLESIRREWVSGDLENALTVLSIWMVALAPWNVARQVTERFSLYYIRWFGFQARFLNGKFSLVSILQAYEFQQGAAIQTAYLAWGMTSVVFILGIAYSVALFVAEDRVAEFARPARVGGALLLVSGIGYSVTSYLLNMWGIPGIQFPLGGLLMLVFGGVLLTNTPNRQPTPAEQPAHS